MEVCSQMMSFKLDHSVCLYEVLMQKLFLMLVFSSFFSTLKFMNGSYIWLNLFEANADSVPNYGNAPSVFK